MRFNRIIRLLPVLLILLLPLTGCEYSDTELVLKGKLDVTDVENHIHGPVIVGVANTDDLEYIMANPQDAVAIMVPVETLDYRFNIDLSDTSLKAGDTVTVFAFADNNYNGGIPMPDAGDLFGMYIDEDSFAATVKLNKGSTYVEFAPDKNYYQHNASITFQLAAGDISETGNSLDEGDNIIIVAVHEDGVDGDYNIDDINYVIAMSEVTYNPDSSHEYNIPVLPAIYYQVPVAEPFGIENVYVYAILDDPNANGKPDEGESVGFYWNRIFNPLEWEYIYFPKLTNIDKDGENVLDETVRFSNETY